MEGNNQSKSDSMKKIEKRCNPKVMNSLQLKVNVNVSVLINIHQDFKMGKCIA